MSVKYIVSIQDSLVEPKVSELGGKGASLLKLTQGQFPIPDGFIITTNGYNAFAEKLHLHDKYCDILKKDTLTLEDAERISLEIEELFQKSEFPTEYADEMVALLDKFKYHQFEGPNLLAIRSSATTEDLADASFAGMQDTILNVPIELEAVKKAVIQCWASLYTPRVLMYRFEKHFPLIDTAIAVVVQRMIPSEKAGVVFSCDPQSSSREHVSLDGVWGLGETLVSGMVSTDHWLIRKHYPVDKKHRELKIVESTINKQQFAYYTKPEGGTEKVMLEEKGKEACFTEEEIYKISEYAVNIEEYYQRPMDIEFCIYKDHIYIVQARPITTLFDLPKDLDPLCKEVKHSYVNLLCFNNVQMMLKPFSYAGYTSINRLIFNSFTYFRWISGFIYVNIMPILAIKPARKLFYMFFGGNVDKEIAQISYEYIESDYMKASRSVSCWSLIKTALKIGPYFMGTFLRYYVFGFNPSTIYQVVNSRITEMIDYFNHYLENVDEKIEKKELTLEQFSHKKYTLIDVIKRVLPFLILSFRCSAILRQLLRKYGIDEHEVEAMCQGRKENIASQMDEEVIQLHCAMDECGKQDDSFMSQLREYLDKEEEDGLKRYIESLKDSSFETHRHFNELYNRFMARFGRRGPGEIDIANDRYADKPSILLKTVMNTNYKDSESKTNEIISQQADAKVEEICALLSSKDAKKLRHYLPMARLVFMYREHPKYMMVSSLYVDRKLYLYYGKKMVEEHMIDDIHDVFHFSYDEILEYEKGTLDFESVKSAYLQRKYLYDKNQSVVPPRVICTEHGVLASISNQTKEELASLPANVMKGMATSSGIVEGRAVVVTDPREGHLKSGDVLVAPATDPGWTPLFVPAGGVVIEIGGPLTHGSIVAREMGIPCVVNVPNLLKRVSTGMRIRVDGGKGTVEILDA